MDTYKCLEHRGDMVHYDSVEAAAEELGLTDLAATLDTHNAHALAGEEDEFGRKKLPYLDTHDGVWVVSCIPTFYLTTGGLAIDTEGHVLSDSGEAVAGLYAAGDVCGSCLLYTSPHGPTSSGTLEAPIPLGTQKKTPPVRPGGVSSACSKQTGLVDAAAHVGGLVLQHLSLIHLLGAWGMVFPILTVVVTQLVGVEQAGMFSLAFVTGTLLMILANYGVRTYQVSDVTEEHSFSDYQINRLITCAFMVLVGVAYCMVRGYESQMFTISLGVYLYKMVDGLADVYEGRLQQVDKLYLSGVSQAFRTCLLYTSRCV